MTDPGAATFCGTPRASNAVSSAVKAATTSAGKFAAAPAATACACSLIVGVGIVISVSTRWIGLIPPENSVVFGLSTPKTLELSDDHPEGPSHAGSHPGRR